MVSVIKKIRIGLALFVVTGCGGKETPPPSAKVDRGDIDIVVSLGGTVRPKKQTMILMPYTGYLRKLFVEVGMQVKKGDPLVAFSTSLAEDAPYPLRAAYPGMVTQLLKSEGDYVSHGAQAESKILKYEDRSEMFVEMDAPEADIAKIKIGQNAKIRINSLPGKTFTGKVVEIFQSAREADNSWDRKGGSFPVSVRIDQDSDELKTGLSSVVEIQIQSKPKVLRLAQEFVKKSGGKFNVTLKKEKRQLEIQAGLRNESFIEILSGLSEGDEVTFPFSESASP